ncbi:MAG: TonB-dependent receptor, partial [Pseudomonadota bacterium]
MKRRLRAPIALALSTGMMVSAFAQDSKQTFAFQIPAQTMAEALVAFSSTTQQQVAADADAIRQIDSNPVRGDMTAETALQRMVSGTGLELVSVNGNSYALRAQASAPMTEQGDAVLVIEEVIVTGTKRNLTIQDTQTSAAVFTMDDIEDQVLFTVDDILLRTANVSTDGSGDLNGLSIRGITLIGVGNAGTGQTANVYVDGSPNSFNANQGAANLWDVAQVEILRGPQSTVQGRNALAGAVIINTADPTYEFGVDARAVVGNENNRQYSATLNIPFIDDTLAFRFAADQREIDFEVTNVDTGNNTRFQDAFTGRAKLLWEPTDRFRAELGYSYTDTEFGEFNAVTAPGPIGTPEFEAFDPFGNITYGFRERFEFNTVHRSYLDLSFELNDRWDLFGLVTHEDSQRDTDFGALGVGDAPDDTTTAELRAAFDFGDVYGWVGAYWFETEGAFQSVFQFPLALFGLPPVPPNSIAIFDTFQEDSTENRALF